MQDKVEEYALQHGFKEAERLGRWKGFDVYALSNPEDVGLLVWLPNFLLVKNGNVVEFVKDGRKTEEILSYLNYLDNLEIETIDVTPKNLSPKEFAEKNGCTNTRLLGRLRGYDVYSMYSPTDEWIEKGEPCFLLVKKGVVVKKVTALLSIEGIISCWIENEYKESETAPEDIRILPKKMYSFDEDIIGDRKLKPRTYEDMRRFLGLYEGVFGDDFCAWHCNADYVCAAVEHCIKTGIPVDQTLPEGVVL